MIKPEIGLAFELYYGEDNVNNNPFNEIRAIVDDLVLVLYSKTKGGRAGYNLMYIDAFNMRVEDENVIVLNKN